MHILVGIALIGALVQAPVSKTFTQRFDEQAEETTKALVAYQNVDCTDSNFNVIALNVKKQLEALGTLIKDTPKDEDMWVKYRQLEIGLGIDEIAAQVIKDQNKCVTDNFYSKDSKSQEGN